MNANEIMRKLENGERVTHNHTGNVMHMTSRGFYVVADENGKRLGVGKIHGLYDAVYFWEGGE